MALAERIDDARHSEIAATPSIWQELQRRLEAQRLLVSGTAPDVARMHPQVAAELASTTARQAAELGAAIRGMVSQRLQRFTSERQRLFRKSSAEMPDQKPLAGTWRRLSSRRRPALLGKADGGAGQRRAARSGVGISACQR